MRRCTLLLLVALAGCGGGGDGGPASGEALVEREGCLSCHAIAGEGEGDIGGDLSTWGRGRTAEEALRVLTEPPESMPDYDRLTDAELGAIADYLVGLR